MSLLTGVGGVCADNPPVGAVVTSPDGARYVERAEQISGSVRTGRAIGWNGLAHAEVNALAQLPPGEYGDATLWSSLEPCPLCAAAAMSSRSGRCGIWWLCPSSATAAVHQF
ncbi:hypothetical protein ACIBCD_42625 [Nocardia brasiliensis]|uniref:hypothetical protein n=1 Tax=Nocardia brasiliensis TaxID=37326 RepID=UPI0037A3CE55